MTAQIIPTEAEKSERIEKAQTIALTERQIEAAVLMGLDSARRKRDADGAWIVPPKRIWLLAPAGVGKRCLYMRQART